MEKAGTLAPCPVCGGVPIMVKETFFSWGRIPANPRFYVRCTSCGHHETASFSGYHGITGETRTADDARRKAVERWNKAGKMASEQTPLAVEAEEITGTFDSDQRPEACPKCGASGVYVAESVWAENGASCVGTWHYIRCTRCGHRAPGAPLRPDMEQTPEAIKDARRKALSWWNEGREHYTDQQRKMKTRGED